MLYGFSSVISNSSRAFHRHRLHRTGYITSSKSIKSFLSSFRSSSLHIELNTVAIEFFILDFMFLILLNWIMELSGLKLDRWSTFLECRSQIDVLRYYSSIQETYHTLVNIILRNGWRILEVLLLLKIPLLFQISQLFLPYNTCHCFFGLIWAIFVIVRCCWM